jgi:hypothetical protein
MDLAGQEEPSSISEEARFDHGDDDSGHFEFSAAKAILRREANQKIMDAVAVFAGSTNLRFRRAAGDLRFRFASEQNDAYRDGLLKLPFHRYLFEYSLMSPC